jgi:hypothetical protein
MAQAQGVNCMELPVIVVIGLPVCAGRSAGEWQAKRRGLRHIVARARQNDESGAQARGAVSAGVKLTQPFDDV